MAMKDALGGWSSSSPMHAQGSTVDTTPAHALGGRATVPADQRRQPAAAVISERRWPPGRPASPTRLHGAHCQTPVPGPSPVTARSHRCDTHYTTALHSPPSVSC